MDALTGLAYAENEWKNAQPWNPATSETLAPGATKTFGLKFLVAPEIRDLEKRSRKTIVPWRWAFPATFCRWTWTRGFFLKYGPNVKSVGVEPADAIAFEKNPPTPNGWQAYTLHGKKWGPRAADDHLRRRFGPDD